MNSCEKRGGWKNLCWGISGNTWVGVKEADGKRSPEAGGGSERVVTEELRGWAAEILEKWLRYHGF